MIADFDPGTDRLVLRDLPGMPARLETLLRRHAENDGTATILDLGEAGRIVIEGVADPATLTDSVDIL